jgi:DNA-binding transcriptional ArsR family regulator
MTSAGDEPYPFDWARLVPRIVHPLRVAIIEALARIGEPLSPSELALVLGDDIAISLVSYHVRELRKVGVIEAVATRQVRGALQTFYWFTADDQ